MSDETKHTGGQASPSLDCSPFGRFQVIADGLQKLGFRLSRGTHIYKDGESPTWCIDRPSTPEWQGVWNGWHPDNDEDETDDDELLTLMIVVMLASREWKIYQDTFSENAGGQATASCGRTNEIDG